MQIGFQHLSCFFQHSDAVQVHLSNCEGSNGVQVYTLIEMLRKSFLNIPKRGKRVANALNTQIEFSVEHLRWNGERKYTN